MVTQPEKTIFDHEIADHLSETTRSWVERPILVMLDGTDVNRRHRMDKPEMMIGRDIMSEIVLNDSRCSRHHAKLLYRNFDQPNQLPEVALVDLGSTNGSFVNGVRVTEQLLHDRDKVMFGSTVFGFFLRDEEELEADQRLYFLARNDALTGLLNRGIFNMEIQKEFDRARRYGRELSLVLFDIDHFKRFNDNYGHQVGDFVLQEMGRLVHLNVRANDLGARYGGEEFAIILPETSLDGALIQAERLRLSIHNHPFTNKDGQHFPLTVSVGVASMEPQIQHLEEFIKASDRALYQAKAEGRDCVCWMQNGKINTGSATQ